jgi:hypothetical protein
MSQPVKTDTNKRLFIVWLILSGLSLAYLWIDHRAEHHGVPEASAAVSVSAIVIALVKVRIIMREFMEVRHAPQLLRRLTDLWLVIMAAVFLGLYFAGRAVA